MPRACGGAAPTDGSPQTSAMWIGRDGDELLFCTIAGRLKERNIGPDPRVSVTVMDRADPEVYTEIRGTATILDEGGHELDDVLSQKYDGKPAYPDLGPATRPRVATSSPR